VANYAHPDALKRAQDFYAIYCASSGGKNFQGNPCPKWSDLPETVRGHWYTVALRAEQLDYDGNSSTLLGEERAKKPGASVLDHLPDQAAALATWEAYSE
jgi:hypothetical protein